MLTRIFVTRSGMLRASVDGGRLPLSPERDIRERFVCSEMCPGMETVGEIQCSDMEGQTEIMHV